MSYGNLIKSIPAKFKSKKQDGIYCQEQDVGTPVPFVLGTSGSLKLSVALVIVS